MTPTAMRSLPTPFVAPAAPMSSASSLAPVTPLAAARPGGGDRPSESATSAERPFAQLLRQHSKPSGTDETRDPRAAAPSSTDTASTPDIHGEGDSRVGQRSEPTSNTAVTPAGESQTGAARKQSFERGTAGSQRTSLAQRQALPRLSIETADQRLAEPESDRLQADGDDDFDRAHADTTVAADAAASALASLAAVASPNASAGRAEPRAVEARPTSAASTSKRAIDADAGGTPITGRASTVTGTGSTSSSGDVASASGSSAVSPADPALASAEPPATAYLGPTQTAATPEAHSDRTPAKENSKKAKAEIVTDARALDGGKSDAAAAAVVAPSSLEAAGRSHVDGDAGGSDGVARRASQAEASAIVKPDADDIRHATGTRSSAPAGSLAFADAVHAAALATAATAAAEAASASTSVSATRIDAPQPTHADAASASANGVASLGGGVIHSLGLAGPALPFAATTSPVFDVRSPVDSAGFASGLSAQVSVIARQGIERAELRLNPAEMGPVSVRIDISGATANVQFGADLAHTRHAIESAIPQLAAALRDAGLTLTGGSVSAQARDASGQAGQNGGDGQGDARRERRVGMAPRGDGSGAAEATTRLRAVSSRAGGVDLYA